MGIVDKAVFGRVLHGRVDAGFVHPEGVGVPARGVGQRRGIGLAQVGVLCQGQGVGGDARVETVGGMGVAQRIEVGAEAVEGSGGATPGGGAVEAGGHGAHSGGAVAHEGRGGERVGRAGVAAAREQGAGVAGQGE